MERSPRSAEHLTSTARRSATRVLARAAGCGTCAETAARAAARRRLTRFLDQHLHQYAAGANLATVRLVRLPGHLLFELVGFQIDISHRLAQQERSLGSEVVLGVRSMRGLDDRDMRTAPFQNKCWMKSWFLSQPPLKFCTKRTPFSTSRRASKHCGPNVAVVLSLRPYISRVALVSPFKSMTPTVNRSAAGDLPLANKRGCQRVRRQSTGQLRAESGKKLW